MLEIREKRFSYSISTLGCKANLTDSQAIEAQLQDLGGHAAEARETPDLFLLNTCTVTDQADSQARALLRRSNAKLTIATGCLAQVDPDQLRKAGQQIHIVRNSGKSEIEGLIADWLGGNLEEQKIHHGDRLKWHGEILPNRPAAAERPLSAMPRTRAFYKVQDGCNAFCSYCVIPLARGRSRSLPVSQILRDIQSLVDAGTKEVAITAIHAADYSDSGLDFTGLVEEILAKTTLNRLRLTSLDPAEISDRLLALMESEPRLCPHFHVSLQSASSRVLQAMKRAYSAEQVEDRLQKISACLPQAYVGLDMIAGFPGETDEEFQESFERLERLPWTRAHVFPFSVRRNTAAARLVISGLGVPSKKIRDRASALRALSEKKLISALHAKVGSVMEVLVEEKKVGAFSLGHSRSYFKVKVPGDHKANTAVRVRIVGVGEKECLEGESV